MCETSQNSNEYGYKSPIGKGNRRDQYWWNVSPEGLRWLLPQVLPYLLVKKKHAEIVLELLSKNSRSKRLPNERKMELRDEIRRLNIKGRKQSEEEVIFVQKATD